MTRSARATVVALIAVAALLVSATAQATSNPALKDCIAHQTLTRQYSISVLKQAVSSMTPETREYSACPDVLNRAIAAAVSGKGGPGSSGGGGSGSFLPTPVIVILVILVLAAAVFGGIAIRRRRDGDGDAEGDGGP
jgi:hypothetical protein